MAVLFYLAFLAFFLAVVYIFAGFEAFKVFGLVFGTTAAFVLCIVILAECVRLIKKRKNP